MLESKQCWEAIFAIRRTDSSPPQLMKNVDEIVKDISSFMNLLDTMDAEDSTCQFQWKTELYSHYWRAVRGALLKPIVPEAPLRSGLWL